uniref:DHR10 domain-containing protein n=3 Tax=Caenorhabditis tropicalis TaxID=1561998 RepID=A0A1I7UH54_9PELO
MSLTPNLDKLFDISMRLNKASVYGSSNPLVTRELERAVHSINASLRNLSSQRDTFDHDTDSLEWEAYRFVGYFQLEFQELAVLFGKEEEVEKKRKEEEEERRKQALALAAFTSNHLDTLEDEKRAEESIETRLQALRIEDKGEIRRLKRARCKMCRKNSKLTEENEKLKEKVEESTRLEDELKTAKARSEKAMAEVKVLKGTIEVLMDVNKNFENQINKYREEKVRHEGTFMALNTLLHQERQSSFAKDEKIKQLEEEKVTLKKKLDDAEYEIYYR